MTTEALEDRVASAISHAIRRAATRSDKVTGFMTTEIYNQSRRRKLAVFTIFASLSLGGWVFQYLKGPEMEMQRIFVTIIGGLLCIVASTIDHNYRYQQGENLFHGVEAEEDGEDITSPNYKPGPLRIAAERHIRGHGLTSVEAATFCSYLVWVFIACTMIIGT